MGTPAPGEVPRHGRLVGHLQGYPRYPGLSSEAVLGLLAGTPGGTTLPPVGANQTNVPPQPNIP